MKTIPFRERIDLLTALGRYILSGSPALQEVMERSLYHNAWFTLENQKAALDAIAGHFLDPEKLEQWLQPYLLRDPERPVTVALVMAGNLPLVGFHDWLCVFVAGHKAQIKLSEKDRFLLPHLLGVLTEMDARFGEYVSFTDRLAGFDAVIATGSNNSARYFEYYFGKYPHIIRKNRNAVAALSGNESREELLALGQDVFQYFGMGCRNVSKIYVPQEYDFEPLLEALHEFREIILHDKYKNNYDYNYALMLINRVSFKMNGCVLLVESSSIPSRIADLHYSFYDSLGALEQELKSREAEIQCICAPAGLLSLPSVPFGKAQEPELWDYADGVDTLAFLAAQ